MTTHSSQRTRSAFGPGLASALLAALCLAGSPPLPAATGDALARGDAAWERRGAGHRADRAEPGPIAEAVAAYEQAAAERPSSLEPRWKLLRALYFQGDFAERDSDARRRVFERGRDVAEASLELLALRAGVELGALEPAQAAARLAGVPEAAPVYFWSAVHWGLWGEAFGKLAAARQGVAKRLRDYAETVIALDPLYENGGGHRVLGRLHSEAPRIPFITGWVSREKAIAELRRAVELAPEDPFNRLYLAEALLDHGGASARPEALALLRRLGELEPRPEQAVEDARIRAEARRELAALSR